jgi:hypothetical protein
VAATSGADNHREECNSCGGATLWFRGIDATLPARPAFDTFEPGSSPVITIAEVKQMPVWAWILIILFIVFLLGGFGYSRR